MGEQIRGQINGAVSGALNDKAGAAEAEGVTRKGETEVTTGQYQGHPEAVNRF